MTVFQFRKVNMNFCKLILGTFKRQKLIVYILPIDLSSNLGYHLFGIR